MIKINYNRNNPLVHRFISHIEEADANIILNRVHASKQSKKSHQKGNHRHEPKRKSDFSEPPFAIQETKIITEFSSIRENRQSHAKTEGYQETRFGEYLSNNNKKSKNNQLPSTTRKNSHDRTEPLLEEFIKDQSNNFALLREGYLRLWYEKMALENNFNSVLNENIRKDQIINQLRQQLEQQNGYQPSAPIFYNPQTPMHSSNQNKTLNSQQTPNQSMHSNSVNLMNNLNGTTNTNHWGAIHPNRNFNPVGARNF